ncbi:hypothetical protein L0222_31610 [bacterium]|nr:hypothetical protein [bacterium]
MIKELSLCLGTIAELREKYSAALEIIKSSRHQKWEAELFGKLTEQVKREEVLMPHKVYRILGMSWYGKGLYVKYEKAGNQIRARTLYQVEKGDFVYNRLFAWKGSFAEVEDHTASCYVSNEYPCFKIIDRRIVPGYLWCYFSQPELWHFVEELSTGTTSTSRLRLKEVKLNNFLIPLPPKLIQEKMVDLWRAALGHEPTGERISSLLIEITSSVLERVIPVTID